MDLKICRGIVLFAVLLLSSLTAKGQIVDTSNKLDSLELSERISVRTNAVDWLLLVPNVGVEFDLGRYNWNRYSLLFGVKGNWQTSHSFKPAQVYNIAKVHAEVRQYWRTRKINNDTTDLSKQTSVMPARNILQRLLSTNRYSLKHPNTTYYRGIYAAYTKYSVLLMKKGRQGSAFSAGFTYGIIKPLYEFKSGNSLDLEFGLSAGICITKNDEYCHDRESDCYPVTAKNGWHLLPYPMLSEARVAFVYRFGSYPVTKKYRWRYDVDADYREKMDEKLRDKTEKTRKKMDMDDLRKLFNDLYDHYYPEQLKKAEAQAGSDTANTKKGGKS